MKHFENLIPYPKVRRVIGVIAILILALLIFHAGVVFGSHRDSFHQGSFGRSDTGHGFRHPFLPQGFELPHGFIPNTHGAVGTITARTSTTFTMQTREGTSQTVVTSSSTMIRNVQEGSPAALSVGTQVLVLGESDSEGRLNAKFVRILSVTPTP